jgi:hypothetical protein
MSPNQNPPPNPTPRNWTQVATQLGYDTKATNISFRIKEWLRFHHIDAFFDYLMDLPNEFYSGLAKPQQMQPTTLYTMNSTQYRYSLDGHMDAMEIADNIEPNRKRSSDSLYDIRKRASLNSISSPMRSLRDDVDEQYEHMDQSQLMQTVYQLQQDVLDLQQTCRRYEDHLGVKDQQMRVLQQELEEKNVQLNKAAQFKDFILRYIEYLPDNVKM